MHSLLEHDAKTMELAVDLLRRSESALMAFDTEHPSIAPEAVPKGKHDLPEPVAELPPHTHTKKPRHLAGKAAKHQSELARQRAQLSDNLVANGILLDWVKGLQAERDEELKDIQAHLQKHVAAMCEADQSEEMLEMLTKSVNELMAELAGEI